MFLFILLFVSLFSVDLQGMRPARVFKELFSHTQKTFDTSEAEGQNSSKGSEITFNLPKSLYDAKKDAPNKLVPLNHKDVSQCLALSKSLQDAKIPKDFLEKFSMTCSELEEAKQLNSDLEAELQGAQKKLSISESERQKLDDQVQRHAATIERMEQNFAAEVNAFVKQLNASKAEQHRVLEQKNSLLKNINDTLQLSESDKAQLQVKLYGVEGQLKSERELSKNLNNEIQRMGREQNEECAKKRKSLMSCIKKLVIKKVLSNYIKNA